MRYFSCSSTAMEVTSVTFGSSHLVFGMLFFLVCCILACCFLVFFLSCCFFVYCFLLCWFFLVCFFCYAVFFGISFFVCFFGMRYFSCSSTVVEVTSVTFGSSHQMAAIYTQLFITSSKYIINKYASRKFEIFQV